MEMEGLHIFIGIMFFSNVLLVLVINKFYLPDVIISSVLWFKGIDAGADKLAILSIAGVFCSIVCFFIRPRKAKNLRTLVRDGVDDLADQVHLHVFTEAAPRKDRTYFCEIRGKWEEKGTHLGKMGKQINDELKSGPLSIFYNNPNTSQTEEAK